MLAITSEHVHVNSTVLYMGSALKSKPVGNTVIVAFYNGMSFARQIRILHVLLMFREKYATKC